MLHTPSIPLPSVLRFAKYACQHGAAAAAQNFIRKVKKPVPESCSGKNFHHIQISCVLESQKLNNATIYQLKISQSTVEQHSFLTFTIEYHIQSAMVRTIKFTFRKNSGTGSYKTRNCHIFASKLLTLIHSSHKSLQPRVEDCGY